MNETLVKKKKHREQARVQFNHFRHEKNILRKIMKMRTFLATQSNE